MSALGRVPPQAHRYVPLTLAIFCRQAPRSSTPFSQHTGEDLILPLRRPASCTTVWGLSAMRQKVNDITQNLAGPDPNLPLPQRDMAPLNDGYCGLPASQLSRCGCVCRAIASLASLPPTDHTQPRFSHSTLVSTTFTRPRNRPRHPHGFVDVSLDHHIYPDFV